MSATKKKNAQTGQTTPDWLQTRPHPLHKSILLGALLIPLVYLIVSFLVIADYGITVDEPACFDFGHKYWQFYTTGYLDTYGSTPADDHHPDFSVNWEEGVVWPLINTLSAATCDLFYQHLKILSPIDAHHAVIPLVVAPFLYLLFIWIARYWNPFIAFLTVAGLATYPYFFGFAFNNTKDIPRLAFFAANIFLFVQWFETRKAGYLYAAFAFWGFFLGVRMEASLVPVILFLWMLPELLHAVKGKTLFSSRLPLHFLGGACVAALCFVLCWPPLLPWAYDSFSNFREDAPRFARDIFLFMRYASSQNDPMYSTWNIYALRQIYYMTPVPLLILFVFGVFYVKKRFRENKHYFLLLVWLVFILGRHCFPNIAHYCGMRHFLDFLIPFMMVAAFGAESLSLRIGRQFSLNGILSRALVAAVFVFPNIRAIIKYHPYEILYYNRLAGGLPGAQQKCVPWSFDYFLTSYRQAGEWLDKHAVKDANYFAVYDSVIFRHYITRKDLHGIFRRPGQIDFPPNTYLVINMHFNQPSILDDMYDVVYHVQREGASVLKIYFLSKNARDAVTLFQRAIEAANTNNPDLAMACINESIKKNPRFYQSYYLQGMLYFRKGSLNETAEALRKTLELKPGYAEARRQLDYVLGQLHK